LRRIPAASSEIGNVGDYGGNRDDYGKVKTREKDEEREVFDSLRVFLGNDAYLLDYDSSDDDDYDDNDETDERNTNDVNNPISNTSEEEELQQMIQLVNNTQRDSLSLARTKLFRHRELRRHEQQQQQQQQQQLCQNILQGAYGLEENETENHYQDEDISNTDAAVQTSFSSDQELVATTVIDDDDYFDCDHDGSNIINKHRECKNNHIRENAKIINNKNNDDDNSKKNNNKGRISLPIMSRVSIVLQQMFGDEIDVIIPNDNKNVCDGGKGGNVGVGKKKGSRRENTRLQRCNRTFASQDNIACVDDDVVIDDEGDDDDDQDLIVTWRK